MRLGAGDEADRDIEVPTSSNRRSFKKLVLAVDDWGQMRESCGGSRQGVGRTGEGIVLEEVCSTSGGAVDPAGNPQEDSDSACWRWVCEAVCWNIC